MRLMLKMEILATYGSQNSFTKIINKSPSWLSQVIRGRMNPTTKERATIAKALRIEDEESLFAMRRFI